MTVKLPASWQRVEIGDVAKVIGGGTPPAGDAANFAKPGTATPWLTPADLSGYRGQYVSHGARDLSAAGLAVSSAKLLPKGAVLFSSRAPVGYVAIAAGNLTTNQGFKSFVFRPGMDSRFAYYQLRHLKPTAEAMATGTTFKELSGAVAAKLPFVIAPAATQQRIADKLDTVLARVDACRDRLARVAPLLKRFRQSVLAAGTSGQLTRDIREQATVDHLPFPTICDSGVWASTELPSVWEIRGFGECFIDLTDSTRKLPQKLYQTSGVAPVIDQGSVLIGGYTDDVSLFSRERPPFIVFGDHTRCVKWIDFPFVQGADGVKVLKAKGIEPKFAYLLLLAIELPDKGYSRHFKFLRRSMFPVPPQAEQVEIVRRVETLCAFADRIEARLAKAQTAVDRLTPSLLAKAFRGELVPQDPADEPATELLKRLASDLGAKAAVPRKVRKGQLA